MNIRSLILALIVLVLALITFAPAPVVTTVAPVAAQNGCGPEGFGGLVPDLWFTPACNKHDICYGTPGANRATCDSRFYSDMKAICAQRAWYSRPACYASAWTYYQAVRAFGQSAFDAAQRR